ncbi:MAG: CBS domain-containing protein [Desulfobulbaceae bacterium]|nr:MAG: CBS domain-containing protein [Desulfobulbaceae bacterium]
MSVGKFCNRQVVVADRHSDIVAVAKLMRRHHVGDVVLVQDITVDNKVPVGIITDRDLVIELMALEVNLETVNVGDAMSYELVTCCETDSLCDALQRMQARHVRRLVVVDEAGCLSGILTVDDLVELLAEEMSGVARVVMGQPERERRCRV